MRRDGYTMVEMLAALLVVGLAFGGLTEAVQVVGRMQGAAEVKVAHGQSLRDLQRAFSSLFAQQGPFRSADNGRFAGDLRSFRFSCSNGFCGAQLSDQGGGVQIALSGPDGAATLNIPDVRSARFAYVGADGPLAAWPPAKGAEQRLRSVILEADGKGGLTPIAIGRVWRDLEADCQFDLILKDCRGAGA